MYAKSTFWKVFSLSYSQNIDKLVYIILKSSLRYTIRNEGDSLIYYVKSNITYGAYDSFLLYL